MPDLKLTPMSRRKAVKALITGSSAATVLSVLPARWAKPLVETIVVPAHAQTSPPTETVDCTDGLQIVGRHHAYYPGDYLDWEHTYFGATPVPADHVAVNIGLAVIGYQPGDTFEWEVAYDTNGWFQDPPGVAFDQSTWDQLDSDVTNGARVPDISFAIASTYYRVTVTRQGCDTPLRRAVHLRAESVGGSHWFGGFVSSWNIYLQEVDPDTLASLGSEWLDLSL